MRFGGGVLVPAFVLVFCAFLSAQTFLGAIRGRVADRDGVVPHAAIELVSRDTGVTRTAHANDAGEFLFADLPPGRYTLNARAPGYGETTIGNLVVNTRSSLTQDVVLEPAAVHDTLALSAPLLDRAAGPLGMSFSNRDLVQQPTAGRNIFIMGALAPTVLPTGNAVFVRQQDQSNASLISMDGSGRRANTYVIDGLPIVDIQNRATIIPGMESVDEMRVQLGPYDADIGRTSGGVFNVTARGGTNTWNGSAVYQNRPDATQSQLFFASKAGTRAPATSYHLFAGSFGGPLIHNRTFVFGSGEGYRTQSPRSTVLRMPTAAERRGDFSQSGITIFDPLTTRPSPSSPSGFVRDPFPNNQIPASRLNPVALAMLAYLPSPASGKSLPATVNVLDEARQFFTKATQQWSASHTTSLTYAWYRSAEPDARFYGGSLFQNGADPGDGALVRRVNFVAANHQWAVRDRSLLQLRYGLNQFLDDNRGADFDPASLGFDSRFISSVPFRKFPGISVGEYGNGGAFLGDRDRQRGVFYAHNASAVMTQLAGRHELRAGGEYRRIGIDFRNLGGSGSFGFSSDFTRGPDPLSPAGGDAFASFLLGYPSNGSISTSSPINAYIRYGAAFVQDDFRITPRLTVNAGLRYEYEDGLRETHDRIAVKWADTPFPIQVGGTRPDGTPLQLTGGLVYAGVNGAPGFQGAPDHWKFSPRVSAAFSIGDATVLRAGYGVFRAPQQGISASETDTGTRGYNVTTNYVATLDNPFIPCSTCTLTNPFPAGFSQPTGNAQGVMTGVGGGVEFIDPATTPAHYRRYSAEMQHRAGGVLFSAAYAGAIGRDLMNGGSSGAFVNVNQLDPRYQSLGSALLSPVANPFAGTPLGVGVLSGATVPAAQLLRPYPQFDAVYALRSSQARSRYDALILAADRSSTRWSLRANYTWSRQRDNQYSESNFFSEGSSTQNYYDINADYGLSVLDTPHRLNASGTIDLPFGFAASAAATLQSGFPIAVLQATQNTGLLAGAQRPNVVSGVEPLLTNNPADAFDPACGCIRWLNPAAWSAAAPFTFGNAPRVDGRARTPGRRLVDVALDRTIHLSRTQLALRAEVINIFNARDFRGPNNTWGSSTFGEIVGDSGFPRLLQLRARLAW